MGAVDGIEVDREADVILNQHELDHAAALQEVRCVAYGEDVRTGEDGEVLADSISLEGADEDDCARFGFGHVGDTPDMNGHIVDGLIGGECIQGLSHGIASENADIEGRARRRRDGRADEFAEVDEVGSLDIVFGRLGRLRHSDGA